MERLRAALLGCLLTGGVLFGARPILPERRPIRPVVYAAGPGNALGRTPEQLARWFQPLPNGAAFTMPSYERPPAHTRRRCHRADRRRCR